MIKPINEYILLKSYDEERRIGKLIITTNEKNKSNVGEVVACSKFKTEDVVLNPGDKVIYRDYAVTEYVEGSEKYFLVQLEDILGVIISGD